MPLLHTVREKEDSQQIVKLYRKNSLIFLRKVVMGIRKIATKSWYNIPKEQQVSMDIFRKPILSMTATGVMQYSQGYDIVYKEISFKNKLNVEVFYRNCLLDIKWFSLAERRYHTRFIREKNRPVLCSYDGQIYSTNSKVAYVITLEGNLITHDHIVCDRTQGQTYFHSTLAAGMPVICAGLLSVSNGIIHYISNESGHYKPGIGNLYNAVKLLDKVISLDCIICVIGFAVNEETKKLRTVYQARVKGSFLVDMESVGKDGLTIPERYFSIIRKDNDNYKKRLIQAANSHNVQAR
ncbi:hypothetical protein ECHHL_0564 [Ehrlichia chaffeensis str. Heartland]|uniref:hypothetical protein n=1 Tax=Ehrlichia chaffeensis TaxID=945 RepID=UPI000444D2D3|nr:hypothetical protein [Ehrlichia chaffeensis]AHX03721.1 hypothetical protein ECHHL_0564 [Ehrlichia chaffeensis str. Heartland]AHX09614.1 hypothetical protein ECHWAK_0487 [Ehrlichia chaffeensis str. Wakulla]AHX10248.1 hypothetical protein ECHWP_0561 [Ehrlichia chaffeensis str. West Paces]